METVFAILLLGCFDDLNTCEELTRDNYVYHARDLCEEMIPLALEQPTDYPVSVAKCVPMPQELAGSAVRANWSFSEAGALLVSIEPVDNHPTQYAAVEATVQSR